MSTNSGIWFAKAGLLLLGALATFAEATPHRIISLAPHITEQLFAIGAGGQVIATDAASDWPPEARTLPHVANYQSLNLESLLAAHPDLVIAWGDNQRLQIQQIQALGLRVLALDSRHLTDLPDNLRLLGQQTGHERQAGILASQSESRLNRLQATFQQRRPVRVFYQLWAPPLTTVAHGSWIQEALTLCGAQNPFAASPTSYPQISVEAVLAANPELILSAQDQASLQFWQNWSQMTAVSQQRLWLSQPDLLQRLTPRTPDGVEKLCRLIDKIR